MSNLRRRERSDLPGRVFDTAPAMKRIAILCAAASAMLCGQTPGPVRKTIAVPATSNPYLAGMPAGTKARREDMAPAASPALVGMSLQGAAAVKFSVSGAVAHGPIWPLEPAEGSRNLGYHIGSEHGISGVVAPFESLLGVFLGNERPDRSRAPRSLIFRPKDREFTTLSPKLKQVFFIGAGVTKSGAARRFRVPPDATRLFLGTMDEYNWNNNIGSFSVTVTRETSDVTSNLFSVDSTVSFANWPCLPDHVRCTPDRAIVEARAPGLYHVLLPAQLEWGASVPNPSGVKPAIRGTRGSVCLDGNPERCSGPEGKGAPGGDAFLAPAEAPGALVVKTSAGRTWFSVNDQSGAAFQQHEGFFEFDVSIREGMRPAR